MSDANFINAYNEVILENLNAIMKQNFMFQTQIKFLDEKVKEIPILQEKGNLYESVVRENANLQNKIVSLTSEVENKDKNNNKRPPRRQRGYQIRETELLAQEDENAKIIKEKEITFK